MLLRGIRSGDLDALRRLYDGTGALAFGMLHTALQDQDRTADGSWRSCAGDQPPGDIRELPLVVRGSDNRRGRRVSRRAL
ncbi:hypothetical protein FVA95_26085 [Pseudonocardia sp. EV170527-09]|uniref:hypothetical protein n=1 Tax=Pseudonocardia sp. EV170527-09 TaxID=2603411 RepID=UPI0011F12A40|nr:hypothetical protein [Pseudonocardia sp. EV170527-09]KAA1015267.1 hypothetical protein FVA95_26085 [Pseudonocardia sp. EV170527-09]